MEKIQFKDLKIQSEIKRALEAMGYEEMTPIQEASLPVIIEGKDVIAQAPTGTGKTCCFSVGAINIVDTSSDNVQVLVLCPTRELALQVTKEIRKTSQFTEGVRTLTVYGGQNIDIQIRALKKKPQIIVGTPGRIMDHMRRKTLDLSNIRLLILDEADEMLNMGFREDLDTILKDSSSERQTLLFSATLPKPILEISDQYQKDAVQIKTTYQESDIPNIKQYYIELKEENKEDALCRIIDTYNFKQALVFCNTKKKVDELSLSLSARGYQVEALHGDLKQAGRDQVMEKFRKGITRILIATDVAARGLDIEGIDVIVNYDFPEDQEYYVHRIGRTARAGRTGAAYSFIVRRDLSKLRQFEKALKTPIERALPPTYEMAEIKKITNRLDEIRELIYVSDLTKYIGFLETAIAEENFALTPIQFAAALLMDSIQNDPENKDEGKDLSEDFGVTRDRRTPKDYVRFFINLGKKDNLSRSELKNMFASKLKIEPSKVRGIEVLNTFSFLELPRNRVEEALKVFNNFTFKKRRVSLEVSIPTGETNKGKDRKKEVPLKRKKKVQDRPSSRKKLRSR